MNSLGSSVLDCPHDENFVCHGHFLLSSFTLYSLFTSPAFPPPYLHSQNLPDNETAADSNNLCPSTDADSDKSRKRSVDQMMGAAKSEDDLSSTAGDGDGTQFTRDGIGRQSISEKRHGTIDAKTTKQYWEIKAKRGESPTKGAGAGRSTEAPRPKTTHFEGVDVLSLIKAAEMKGTVMLGGLGGGDGGGEREIKAREEEDGGGEATKVMPMMMRKSASLESLQKVIQKRESESAKGESGGTGKYLSYATRDGHWRSRAAVCFKPRRFYSSV